VNRSSWADDDTAGATVGLRNSLMALDQRAAGWLSCHHIGTTSKWRRKIRRESRQLSFPFIDGTETVKYGTGPLMMGLVP
jgi:hypothetical protein